MLSGRTSQPQSDLQSLHTSLDPLRFLAQADESIDDPEQYMAVLPGAFLGTGAADTLNTLSSTVLVNYSSKLARQIRINWYSLTAL